jgi:branched-chain amino acid transport system substrate-binding protein
VFVFFAGGGAVKFVKDWQAAGLKDKIPLYASGFLTDGTLEAQGAAAQGLETTLHYADGLTNPRDKSFRLDYAKPTSCSPMSTRCRATTPRNCWPLAPMR